MGIKIDTESAIKDFKDYDIKTQTKMDHTLDTYANLIRSSQWSILRNKVIKWTGVLANSIKVTRRKGVREIGPQGVVYAKWIEYGGGSFPGYHYMEESLNKHKNSFTQKLKKDIEK